MRIKWRYHNLQHNNDQHLKLCGIVAPKEQSVVGLSILMETFAKIQAPTMSMLFDGISQQLDFSSCGEEGNSSDNSSDDYVSRIQSPRMRSPSSVRRSPREQRHRSRSNTLSSSLQCTSPIPYASWRKLRLCDSPSTPKAGNDLDQLSLLCPSVTGWLIIWVSLKL